MKRLVSVLGVLIVCAILLFSSVAESSNSLTLTDGIYIVGDVIKPGHYDLCMNYDGEILNDDKWDDYPFAMIRVSLNLEQFYSEPKKAKQVLVISGQKAHLDLIDGMVLYISTGDESEIQNAGNEVLLIW